MPADLWIWVVPDLLDSSKFGSVQLALIRFKHRRLINTKFALEEIWDLHLFFKKRSRKLHMHSCGRLYTRRAYWKSHIAMYVLILFFFFFVSRDFIWFYDLQVLCVESFAHSKSKERTVLSVVPKNIFVDRDEKFTALCCSFVLQLLLFHCCIWSTTQRNQRKIFLIGIPLLVSDTKTGSLLHFKVLGFSDRSDQIG